MLQPDDVLQGSEQDKRVILTVQPRIAAGSLAFAELPAGMLDDSGTFSGAAAKEIQEETGLTVPQDELLDLTALALDGPVTAKAEPSDREEKLQRAVYPSAGGCDEFIPVFLHERRLPRKDISELEGKLTGLRAHGEKITLKLVPLGELCRHATRDSKALAAWALYTSLKRDESI